MIGLVNLFSYDGWYDGLGTICLLCTGLAGDNIVGCCTMYLLEYGTSFIWCCASTIHHFTRRGVAQTMD